VSRASGHKKLRVCDVDLSVLDSDLRKVRSFRLKFRLFLFLTIDSLDAFGLL
jgi:hypothetical protein